MEVMGFMDMFPHLIMLLVTWYCLIHTEYVHRYKFQVAVFFLQYFLDLFSKFLPVQEEFLEDVVLEENRGLPCFLFGHSTGGAIVLKVKQRCLI